MHTSSANTSHHSGDQHKIGALNRSLQSAPNQRKNRADEQAIDPANAVSQPAASKATEDASEIVNTDDAALVGSVGYSAIGFANANLSHVVGRGVDAAHDALVISFEENTNK